MALNAKSNRIAWKKPGGFPDRPLTMIVPYGPAGGSGQVAAGVIGFLLRRSGYSIPGIVLGLILGKIGEQNFAQGMQMVHYDLVTYMSRPICFILIVAGAITLGTGVYKALAANRAKAA
jgi:TctA family transporter